MITGRDIIVMGIQAWDIGIGSNCKNIAAEFAKNNRVLYVNPPMDRVSRFKERRTEKIKKRLKLRQQDQIALEVVSENLWNLYPKQMTESINSIPLSRVFDRLNRINAKRFAQDVQEAISALGFKDYIVFNDSSMFLGQHIKELLQPKCYVYYMRDYLIKNPYWKKHGVRLEPKLIANADVVVCNSTLYAEYGKRYNPHTYMVGQGCDVSLFDDQIKPITVAEDLKHIKNPIIGYVGFLSSRRLDIDLLQKIANARPDWNLVFVGPEDEAFRASGLHGMNNVHFLGSRDANELPAYIKGFDIAINPQLINDSTMGNYPRKIDEYLTMGKPTVASATKAMEYFKENTYLGVSAEDYLNNIARALVENSPELEAKRRMTGLEHTWENNVANIYECIDKVEKKQGL